VVDVSSKLVGLRRSQGLTHWRVHAPGGEWYDGFESVPESRRGKWLPTLFPPANAAGLGLEKALRLLPHHQVRKTPRWPRSWANFSRS
jgi:hypothetical protein